MSKDEASAPGLLYWQAMTSSRRGPGLVHIVTVDRPIGTVCGLRFTGLNRVPRARGPATCPRCLIGLEQHFADIEWRARDKEIRCRPGWDDLSEERQWRTIYVSYLQSEAWRMRSAAAIKRDGNVCMNCKRSRGVLQAHHLTYDRLACERPSDLKTLCKPCHDALHETKRNGKAVWARRPVAYGEWEAFIDDDLDCVE